MNFKRRNFFRIGLALVAGLVISAALPETAEAKHKRKVSHHCGACHAPVYVEYRFVGYDRCGHPVYCWVEVPHRCQHHGHGHGHSYGARDPLADAITGIIRSLGRR